MILVVVGILPSENVPNDFSHFCTFCTQNSYKIVVFDSNHL